MLSYGVLGHKLHYDDPIFKSSYFLNPDDLKHSEDRYEKLKSHTFKEKYETVSTNWRQMLKLGFDVELRCFGTSTYDVLRYDDPIFKSSYFLNPDDFKHSEDRYEKLNSHTFKEKYETSTASWRLTLNLKLKLNYGVLGHWRMLCCTMMTLFLKAHGHFVQNFCKSNTPKTYMILKDHNVLCKSASYLHLRTPYGSRSVQHFLLKFRAADFKVQ